MITCAQPKKLSAARTPSQRSQLLRDDLGQLLERGLRHDRQDLIVDAVIRAARTVLLVGR